MDLFRKKIKFPVYLIKIMNTTFNFSRFLKVLSSEWRLNLKKMLLFWGGIIIIAVLYFVFVRYLEQDITSKNMTFGLSFFLMCILQGFYLQNYFHEFSFKTKTQGLLLLPASRNETFWAKFLLGFILYAVFFSVFMFITVKWTGIQNDWIKEIKDLDEWRLQNYERAYQTLGMDLNTRLILFLVWLLSASAYLFGIMTFKKLAAFKSLALWFGIFVGLWFITYIIYALFTDVWPIRAFPGIYIDTATAYYKSYNIRSTIGCDISAMYPEFLYGLGIFICLALIFISRVKYNEKTI